MKNVKKITSIILVVLMAVTMFSACGKKENNAGIESIKTAGVLKVGVKSDVPNFGLQNTATGEYDGLEIDLAKALAKKIFGDETKVECQTVTAKTRGPLLDTGEIDIVLATFTITEERKETYNFTEPYYTDYVSLMVKVDSGINSLKDLAGKKIGVAQSATSKAAVEAAATEQGVEGITYSEFSSYPEIKAALDSGNVAAFCVDGSILSGYLDSTVKILDDKFSPQNYGIASKLDNKDLAEYLNDFIAEIKGNGELDTLYEKWNLK